MPNDPFSAPTASGVIQPGDTIVARIQNRRGFKINLPQPLAPGELGWCIDTKELFIGLDASTSTSTILLKNQIDAQNIIDNKIIEFESKWSALNTTLAGAVDSFGSNESEEQKVADLRALTSNDFINNNPILSNIISSVGVLSHIDVAIDNSVVPVMLQDKIQMITVEESPVIPAVIIITSMIEDPGSPGSWEIDNYSAIPDPLFETDAGLGYRHNELITIPNPNLGGSPAIFRVTTHDDGVTLYENGEGRVFEFERISGGSGYPDLTAGGNVKVTTSKPNIDAMRATGTAILQVSGSGVDAVTMTNNGIGYRTKPFVYASGGGATVNAELKAVWNQSTGEITGVDVVNTGFGYLSPPSIFIAPPISKKLYKFRYHLGFPSANDTDLETSINSLNLKLDVPYYPDTLILDEDRLANVVGFNATISDGYNYLVTIDSNGQVLLTMDSSQQASSLSTVINAISPETPLLAETSQNVEVLTEFSQLPSPPATVVYSTNDLIRGTMNIYTGTWTQLIVTEPDGGPTGPLAFDPNDTNVQHLQFSARLLTGGVYPFITAGTMTIVTDLGEADLSVSLTEVRNPALDSMDLQFRTSVSGGLTYVEYWQDFGGAIEFKFISAQWLA